MAHRVASGLAAAAAEGRMAEELQAMMATETDPAALRVLRHMQADAAQQGPLHQLMRSVKDEFPVMSLVFGMFGVAFSRGMLLSQSAQIIFWNLAAPKIASLVHLQMLKPGKSRWIH